MYLMALSDGDKDTVTFGELDGCKIYRVPNDYDGDTIPEEAKLVGTFRVIGETWHLATNHTEKIDGYKAEQT